MESARASGAGVFTVFWSCSESGSSRCSLTLYDTSKCCLVLFKEVVYLIKGA